MSRPERNVASERKEHMMTAEIRTTLGEGLTCEVRLEHSRYGTPQPSARIALPAGTSHRRLAAALHLFAAAVEASATPHDAWATSSSQSTDTVGYLRLELLHGTKPEADRGLAHLHAVAERLGWS